MYNVKNRSGLTVANCGNYYEAQTMRTLEQMLNGGHTYVDEFISDAEIEEAAILICQFKLRENGRISRRQIDNVVEEIKCYAPENRIQLDNVKRTLINRCF